MTEMTKLGPVPINFTGDAMDPTYLRTLALYRPLSGMSRLTKLCQQRDALYFRAEQLRDCTVDIRVTPDAAHCVVWHRSLHSPSMPFDGTHEGLLAVVDRAIHWMTGTHFDIEQIFNKAESDSYARGDGTPVSTPMQRKLIKDIGRKLGIEITDDLMACRETAARFIAANLDDFYRCVNLRAEERRLHNKLGKGLLAYNLIRRKASQKELCRVFSVSRVSTVLRYERAFTSWWDARTGTPHLESTVHKLVIDLMGPSDRLGKEYHQQRDELARVMRRELLSFSGEVPDILRWDTTCRLTGPLWRPLTLAQNLYPLRVSKP